MPLDASTLQTEIERFMVPTTPPDEDHLPELGWPDDVTLPPDPVTGTTSAPGIGNDSFNAPGASPSHVGGYASLPPYWEGVEIIGVSGTLVTVAKPASDPSGPQVGNVAATADDQVIYSLPGSPNVSQVQSIERTAPIVTDIAPDADDPGHDPANGIIAIGNPDPDTILDGDDLEFTYLVSFAGPVPSGVDFVIAPPKPPPALGFTTGDAWSVAYRVFVEGGAANGVSPTPGSLSGAESAMKAVIDGMMATPGLGAVSLQAGALAFWGVVAAGSAAIFSGSLAAVPPPTLAGMSAAVLAAGASTLAIPIPDPWDDTASVTSAGIFAAAILATTQGGLVIFQPGPSPAPFPFL
jgi:hypothetical protein